jgi:hypothetical protein
MENFIISVIVLLWCFGVIYLIRKSIINMLRYKRGRNPYHRICRKCGAHQVVYESCFGTWWDEVYPIGNDPNCKCHKDTEQRDW